MLVSGIAANDIHLIGVGRKKFLNDLRSPHPIVLICPVLWRRPGHGNTFSAHLIPIIGDARTITLIDIGFYKVVTTLFEQLTNGGLATTRRACNEDVHGFMITKSTSRCFKHKYYWDELNNSGDEEQVNASRPVLHGRWLLVKTVNYEDIVVSEIEELIRTEDVD